MIPNITPYDSVEGFIEPIPLTIDIDKLNQDVQMFFDKFKFDKYAVFNVPTRNINFNFNYPSKVPDAMFKEERLRYVGPIALGEEELLKYFKVSTSDFDTMPEIVQASYIGEVTKLVEDWHNSNRSHLGKINRIHCVVLANGSGHRLHVDVKTSCRYHIALTTNRYSYMMVDTDNEVKTVHIPADGRVWFLDTRTDHAAQNIAPHHIGKDARLRLHLIFSVSE